MGAAAGGADCVRRHCHQLTAGAVASVVPRLATEPRRIGWDAPRVQSEAGSMPVPNARGQQFRLCPAYAANARWHRKGMTLPAFPLTVATEARYVTGATWRAFA